MHCLGLHARPTREARASAVADDPEEHDREPSLRHDPDEAKAAIARIHEVDPGMEREVLTGSAQHIAELCQRYADVGFRHFIYRSPAPYDEETLERFAREVRLGLT